MNDFSNVDDLWRATVLALLKRGALIESRAGVTKELWGFTAVLQPTSQNWLWNIRRAACPIYGAAELVWYLSGKQSGEMIRHYAPKYLSFLNERGDADGAYGYRWARAHQLRNVIELLQRDSNTRQAVMTCWEPMDLQRVHDQKTKDAPCTLSLQFILRDSLHLITTMRSNDVWLGMPYDIWCFTSIQRLVAQALNVPVGKYVHQVGSIHLYAKNWTAAEQALQGTSDGITTELPAARPMSNLDIHDWGTLDLAMQAVVTLEELSRCISPESEKDGSHPVFGLPGMLTECAQLLAYYNGWSVQSLDPRWRNVRRKRVTS